jgi:hypothetical protein
MPPQNGDFFFRRNASVAFSCVRSAILTDERFLHFQLRQDTPYDRTPAPPPLLGFRVKPAGPGDSVVEAGNQHQRGD